MIQRQNFLFTTWEGGGNITPALEAARRLVAAGHRVRFMSDACNRPESEAAGTTFIAWKRAPSRATRTRATELCKDWEASNPAEGLIAFIHAVWCGKSMAYARDVMEELHREPADLVVTSEMLVGVMAGCESLGQKFVLLCPNVSLEPLPGVPPMGPGLTPARTDKDRAQHAAISQAVVNLFDAGLPALNATRETLGLPALAHLFDQFRAAERTLLATSRAFDFASDAVPEHVRYIGPLISDPAWARDWKSPWGADDTRPLIAVGFSTTFQNHTGILQSILDALAPLPVRVLVTLGGSVHAGELRPAANSVVVESAPHTHVMREAAVAITHGGHGTVMRALVNRVPQLVIPHGRDQNDNAARITHRGAGLTLLPQEATVDAIRTACQRLLGEPTFRKAAQDLGSHAAEEAARCTVVEELENAARQRRVEAA